MKSFFTDREVRKFSFKERITYMLNQLHAVLQPVESPYSYNVVCTIDSKKVSFINKIELPFSNASIKMISGNIEIKDGSFCCQFPPEMLLEIQKRFKKVKLLK